MKTQTGQILVEREIPESLKQSRKFCRVIRIQKKPYLGVLKNHKQFRVAEAKLSPSNGE